MVKPKTIQEQQLRGLIQDTLYSIELENDMKTLNLRLQSELGSNTKTLKRKHQMLKNRITMRLKVKQDMQDALKNMI